MKNAFQSLILIVLFMLAAAPSSAGQPPTIDLRINKITVTRGEKLYLSIRLINGSSHAIKLKEGEDSHKGEAEYLVDIRDLEGHQAPLTEYGEGIYKNGEPFTPGTFRATVLQPGQSVSDGVGVDKIYDLSQPGTYAIWVSRKFDDGSGLRFIQSNKVTVTVTP
jgi:hypothetical protein